jgi:hypothetical protein
MWAMTAIRWVSPASLCSTPNSDIISDDPAGANADYVLGGVGFSF